MSGGSCWASLRQHTLGAALEFLDELSVLFYFPEVLEGVVFVNPQVLLDKATELVEMLYKLQVKEKSEGKWEVHGRCSWITVVSIWNSSKARIQPALRPWSVY